MAESGHGLRLIVWRKRDAERDEKLRVTCYYKEKDKNLYQTCKHFDLNSKTVLRWIKDEENIREEAGIGCYSLAMTLTYA